MMTTVLFFAHTSLLLAFGILLSAIFAGIIWNGKNVVKLILLFVVCGLLQLIFYLNFDEELVWKLYPVITHFPIFLFLCFVSKKKFYTAIVAITAAYLFCQPANWIGIMIEIFGGSANASIIVQMIILIVMAIIIVYPIGNYISELYTKRFWSVFIFGIVPVVYYLFDYFMAIRTDSWGTTENAAMEFLPFFLSLVYIIFCVFYYQGEIKKADADRKEQLIRLTSEQQAKEIKAIREGDQRIRILRHDMRLLLNNIAMCIENEDKDNAMRLISGYVSTIDSTVIRRYCENDTINYILSGFASRCEERSITVDMKVTVADFALDEIMFGSILSNALDNAVNAQGEIPGNNRKIVVRLKNADGKLLMSVKNTFCHVPVIVDGQPVSRRPGHGYGTQSIRYLTERLGGNCHFSVQDGWFLLRVVI